MRVAFLFFFLFFILESVSAQINSSDSSIFVSGNWQQYENQTFEVAVDRYSITNGDTTSFLTLKYEASLSIKDSSSNHYVMEWRYKNLKNKNKKDRINKRLHDLGKNVPLLIKTDDTGQFIELVNWEQVKNNMAWEIEKAKKEYVKYPNAQLAFESKRKNYQTKANIEESELQDVQQLLFFHGLYYKQNKETSLNDTTNIVLRNHGGANGTLMLKTFNENEDIANLQYEYCKTTLPPSETFSMVGRHTSRKTDKEHFDILDENYPLAHSEHKISTLLVGSTGWILESVEESRITCQNTITIEKRTIRNKQFVEPRFDAAIR